MTEYIKVKREELVIVLDQLNEWFRWGIDKPRETVRGWLAQPDAPKWHTTPIASFDNYAASCYVTPEQMQAAINAHERSGMDDITDWQEHVNERLVALATRLDELDDHVVFHCDVRDAIAEERRKERLQTVLLVNERIEQHNCAEDTHLYLQQDVISLVRDAITKHSRDEHPFKIEYHERAIHDLVDAAINEHEEEKHNDADKCAGGCLHANVQKYNEEEIT